MCVTQAKKTLKEQKMKNIIQNTGRRDESGNVLFLILIAVALFAALSYAVTQSTRSGSGDASGETALINSAQLAQYPAGVRTSVVRMVIGGVSPDQLLFDPPSEFTNLNASNLAFSVFHPSGGGAVFQNAPKDLIEGSATGEWVFSAAYQISGIGLTDNGVGAANEIIAFLPGVTQGVCRRLNEQLGITDSTPDRIPDAPAGLSIAVPTVTEAMRATGGGSEGIPATNTGGTIDGIFEGQPFGCYRDGAASAVYPTRTYVYYHVLVER
jgi:hypothetical protein